LTEDDNQEVSDLQFLPCCPSIDAWRDHCSTTAFPVRFVRRKQASVHDAREMSPARMWGSAGMLNVHVGIADPRSVIARPTRPDGFLLVHL